MFPSYRNSANCGKRANARQATTLELVMKQVDQLRALECCTCGAGHRFPWPASRTVQGRRQKPIACPTRTQLIHLFHDKPFASGCMGTRLS